MSTEWTDLLVGALVATFGAWAAVVYKMGSDFRRELAGIRSVIEQRVTQLEVNQGKLQVQLENNQRELHSLREELRKWILAEREQPDSG